MTRQNGDARVSEEDKVKKAEELKRVREFKYLGPAFGKKAVRKRKLIGHGIRVGRMEEKS